MQRFVMIAVGMLMLTASSAGAQGVLVRQTESSWRGCVFRLSVMHVPWGEEPHYYATLESEVASPDTCSLTPTVRYFDPSLTEPVLALAVNDLGMVVVNVYTMDYMFRGWPVLHITSVDRNTLEPTTLVGFFLPFSVVPPREEIEALSTTYLNALQPNAGSTQAPGSVTGH
jgi:hypothetical protein